MHKLLKRSLLFLGVLLGLVILAALVAPMLVDANDFKPRIVAEVEEATGRKFAIEGDLELSVFPWLGVTVNGASLGNPAGFDDSVFASLERVDIRVRLLSLFSDRVEIAKVVLVGPTVRLSRHANGEDNWSDLAAGDGTGQESSSEPATKGPDFRVQGVLVENAELRYSDAAAGVEFVMQAFNLDIDAISLPLDTSLSLNTEFELASSNIGGTAALATRLRADPEGDAYGLDAGELELLLSGEAVPGNGELPVSIRWERIEAGLKAEVAEIKSLTVEVLGMSPQLDMQVRNWSAALAYQGDAKLPSFTPQRAMAALDIEAPVTADDKVLNDVAASFKFSGTAQRAALESLAIDLDDSNISGTLSVEDFERMALRFDLVLDAIDADRYLPPASDSPTGGDASSEDVAIPVEMLRGLDVLGTLGIGKLTFMGIRSSDIEVGVDARKDQLRLHPARASLYEGSYSGDIRVDARRDTAR
ncbi:MAG: AsmA family protein, partial [Gammaproteobacteria bacterium]|nr:AsmA family protein [Gammaproteobacteria bacterium]